MWWPFKKKYTKKQIEEARRKAKLLEKLEAIRDRKIKIVPKKEFEDEKTK